MRIIDQNIPQTEQVYFCPSCMYNSKKTGKCPNCGSQLTLPDKNPESLQIGHRREE
jgi:hypothetical protein